ATASRSLGAQLFGRNPLPAGLHEPVATEAGRRSRAAGVLADRAWRWVSLGGGCVVENGRRQVFLSSTSTGLDGALSTTAERWCRTSSRCFHTNVRKRVFSPPFT